MSLTTVAATFSTVVEKHFHIYPWVGGGGGGGGEEEKSDQGRGDRRVAQVKKACTESWPTSLQSPKSRVLLSAVVSPEG